MSSESLGLLGSGGIGTSMTGLAELLAQHGHQVTLLFTRGFNLTHGEQSRWTRNYAARGIRLEMITPAHLASFVGPLADIGYTVPSAVLDYLRGTAFDVVHMNDTDADGFLAIAGHALGESGTDTTHALAMHSPRQWVAELNREPMLLPVDVAMRLAERIAIAGADLLWCPSRYLLGWAKERGYRLPPRVVQQQYVMPTRAWDTSMHDVPVLPSAPGRVQAVVFFARLEERKGLRLFLEAIDVLAPELAGRSVEVIFLGKAVSIGQQSSESFITSRAAHWPLRWRIISDLDQPAAQAFLAGGGRLAVMPSPADNSPCTVYEAIEAGIPFLAARTGGIPELIHDEDRPRVLFDHSKEALVSALRAAIAEGIRPVRPAVSRAENAARWLALHEEMRPLERQCSLPSSRRLLVVVEGTPTAQAVRDLYRQAADLGLAAFNVVVVSAHMTATFDDLNEVQVVAPQRATEILTAILAESPDTTSMLGLHAGTRLAGDAMHRLLAALRLGVADALCPSALTSSGKRADAVGGSVGWSFLNGPAATGCIILAPRALELAMAVDAPADAGPFGGIADRAIVAGASVWPFPDPLAEVSENAFGRFKPFLSVGRIRLYSRSRGDELEALLQLGALAREQNLPRLMIRRLRYQLMRSRMGIAMPVVMALRDRMPTWARRWFA